MGFTTNPDGTRSFTVPPVVGTLTLNNGRTTAFYEQAQYDRALASGATPVGSPPADTTVVDGKQVATTADVPPSADTVTTSESQATPQPPTPPTQPGSNNSNDDGPNQAPTSSGTGAGTSSTSAKSVGPDNNTGPSSSSTQQIINTAFANQRIISQPNVLDQYASYTYSISWYLLTPDQFNGLSTAGPAPGTSNWSLLMQSGGAPIKGRNQFFPNDYYLDDLEIETFLMGGGTNLSTNDMQLKFKVVEPNGLTLIQNLFSAVVAMMKSPTAPAKTTTQPAAGATTVNANQTSQKPNWGAAMYCLTIQFYGYDENGKLVAPATGQYSTTGQFSSTNPKAVIKKYYPFMIQTLDFRTVANQVEYNIVGAPIPYDTATSQARGTIPFAYQLSGQTVQQLLQGSPAATATTATATSDKGARTTTPAPAITKAPPIPDKYNTPGWDNLSSDVQMREQQSWFDTYGRQYNADGSANWGGG